MPPPGNSRPVHEIATAQVMTMTLTMATATAPDVPRGPRGSLGPNLPGSLIVLNLVTEDRGPMSLMSILENRMNTTNVEKEIVTSIRD
jgi:hypothetical protein